MVTENSKVRTKIQPAFEQLLVPHVAKVDKAILPGLTTLNWTSLNIEKYLDRISAALGETRRISSWPHEKSYKSSISRALWDEIQVSFKNISSSYLMLLFLLSPGW